jgi:hypothetical protein
MSTALGIRSPGGSGVDGNPNGAVVARGGGTQGGAERPGQVPCAEPRWVAVSVGMSCCARGTEGSPSRNAYEANRDPRGRGISDEDSDGRYSGRGPGGAQGPGTGS